MKNKQVFLGIWKDYTDKQLRTEFLTVWKAKPRRLAEYKILCADSEYYGSGKAWIFLKLKGYHHFFEINATDPFTGFEGQWLPAPIPKEYLFSDKFPKKDNEQVMSFLLQYFLTPLSSAELKARMLAYPHVSKLIAEMLIKRG